MPNTSLVRSIVKRLIPSTIRSWLHEYRADYQTSKSRDRVVLQNQIIPAMTVILSQNPDARILWIGCRRYTKKYYGLLEKHGAQCFTLDNDPSVARWGRLGRHITGSVLDLRSLYPSQHFDAVLCNGILGWGVNSDDDQQAALEAMAAVTKPSGWLLLGWDTNKIADPLTKASRWFEHTNLPTLPARQIIDGYYTHVYDTFRRRS